MYYSKKTTIGFSRQQPTNPRSRYTGTLCLPFFTDKVYCKLSHKLIIQIDQVMEVGMQILSENVANVI